MTGDVIHDVKCPVLKQPTSKAHIETFYICNFKVDVGEFHHAVHRWVAAFVYVHYGPPMFPSLH